MRAEGWGGEPWVQHLTMKYCATNLLTSRPLLLLRPPRVAEHERIGERAHLLGGRPRPQRGRRQHLVVVDERERREHGALADDGAGQQVPLVLRRVVLRR